MKFFTKSWCQGRLSDEEYLKAPHDYSCYLKKIISQFPPSLREAINHLNVHDGLLQACDVNKIKKILQLTIICGDNESGYFDLALRYAGIDFQNMSLKEITSEISRPDVEILYDEFDLAASNGLFVHRMLLWPKHNEIQIIFKDLEFTKKKRLNRHNG